MAQLFGLLAESARARTRAKITLNVESRCSPPEDVAIALYRITQGSLNNVAKHALATEIGVDLTCDSEGVNVTVRDDGRGFDPNDDSRQLGHGLNNMQARSEGLGGTFHISSGRGQGTTITVRIPL